MKRPDTKCSFMLTDEQPWLAFARAIEKKLFGARDEAFFTSWMIAELFGMQAENIKHHSDGTFILKRLAALTDEQRVQLDQIIESGEVDD